MRRRVLPSNHRDAGQKSSPDRNLRLCCSSAKTARSQRQERVMTVRCSVSSDEEPGDARPRLCQSAENRRGPRNSRRRRSEYIPCDACRASQSAHRPHHPSCSRSRARSFEFGEPLQGLSYGPSMHLRTVLVHRDAGVAYLAGEGLPSDVMLYTERPRYGLRPAGSVTAGRPITSIVARAVTTTQVGRQP